MNKIKSTLILGFLLLLLSGFGGAQTLDGMIIRMEGDKFAVNRGINHQMNPDTVLYVSRVGEPVAIIRVVMVDEHHSLCELQEGVPGKKISIGDTVSLQPFTMPSAEEEPVAMDELTRERMKARAEHQQKVEDNYRDVINRKTHILRFKRGAGGTVKVDTFDVVNLMSTTIIGGPYASINAWYAAGTAYSTYAKYKASQNPSRIRNLQMEITLWDTEYLDAFATYESQKDTISDPAQVSQMRENIYRQKGLDKFYVFQVKIINPGPGAVQLAPFPWHCYLKGPDDKRIKAVNYDEILDKALNPNQVVNGYIYFNRYDERNSPVLKDGRVILELVDVLGNNRNVNFD